MIDPRRQLNRSMNLILMPTEKCNFRCTYCYEDFAIGKMSRSTIDGVKALITRRVERHGLENLELSWFGGEPLMAKEIIYEISEYCNDIYDSGGLKRFTGGLTTNASYLSADVLRRLVAARQTVYQVSLDGHGAGHDLTRRHASGRGTFDLIWPNLVAAHESDIPFEIVLRLHLTPDNLESMDLLVDTIAARFRGDQRFAVLFKLVEDYGGANGANVVSLTPQMAAPFVSHAMAVLAEAGIDSEDGVSSEFESMGSMAAQGAGDALDTAAGGCGYVCYASKPWSLVVRANGAINKCTVDLASEINRVGSIDRSGALKIDGDKMAYWMRGFFTGDANQLGCPAHASV